MKERKNGYIYYEPRKKSDREVIAETAWRSIFRWLTGIVAVLFVFFIGWMLFFHVVSVDGASMQPTLQDNDKLFVLTFRYEPQQGDIVVLQNNTETEGLLVKRVIATEGQVVDIDYDTGRVTVDGEILDETYATDTTQKALNEIAYPYTVPENCVFVMGDNRSESIDSRNSGIGGIDERRIVGKVVFRLYPFSGIDTNE